MDLKFRRNLPLILLLSAILAFLALAMGDLPIVAYPVEKEVWQTEQEATMDSNMTGDVVQLFSFLATKSADTSTQGDDIDETLKASSESDDSANVTEYLEKAIGVTDEAGAGFRLDEE